jgi:hypothetical protein
MTSNPATQESYWKANYAKQKYVETNAAYTRYELAFRTGYEGPSRYPGKRYEGVETDLELELDYERARGPGGLSWAQAKSATHDAWNGVEQAIPGDAN